MTLKKLTLLLSVSGKRNAKIGPFNRFKCIRNIVVTLLLGVADSKYSWKRKRIITCSKRHP